MKNLIIKYTVAVMLLFCTALSRAQSPGSLDATFNSSGAGVGSTSHYTCHAMQSDGKIIIAGNFATYNGVTKNGIARLNADGSLDSTFSTGTGFLQSTGNIGSVADIKIQPDGKILLAGTFGSFNGVVRYDLIRLNTNGSLDTTFNAGSAGRILPNDGGFCNRIFILPNGQILVSGTFWKWNGNNSSTLVKINANGSFDASFTSTSGNGPGGGFVDSMQLLPDGRVLLGGALHHFNSQTTNGLIIINQNGSTSLRFPTTGYQLSNSLPGGGTSLGNLSKAFMEPSGKIIITGHFWIGGVSKAIARINTSGGVESSFNFNDPTVDYSYGVLESVPGTTKYILSGLHYSTVVPGQKFMVRILTDGTIDTSFNLDSNMAPIINIYDVSFLSDEKMIVSGRFNAVFGATTKYAIARLNGGSCANNLTITANVNSPAADNQQAANTIVASNTIGSGASAIYHAADSVLLTPPFAALNGSRVHIYNAGCTGTFLARESDIPEQEYAQNANVYEREKTTEIKAFPNPNNGVFQLSVDNLTKGNIEITNLYGVRVFSTEFKSQKEIEINMQNQPKGIYIVKVISDDQIYADKIIKN